MPQPHKEMVEGWRERVDAARADYINGRISRDVFMATLFRLSYRGQELSSEVRLADHDKLEHERKAREKAARRPTDRRV